MEMRGKNNFYSNRIQISQLGLNFIKNLPEQIEEFGTQDAQQKQNTFSIKKQYRKRGIGINFQEFANKTLEMINKSVRTIENSKKNVQEVNQSKRKLFQNYQNWKNEQNLIKYKVSDSQTRLQQMKLSQYDWKTNSLLMKRQRNNILNHWETVQMTKEKLLQAKLRQMLLKKYPNRANLIKNKKFVIKQLSK